MVDEIQEWEVYGTFCTWQYPQNLSYLIKWGASKYIPTSWVLAKHLEYTQSLVDGVQRLHWDMPSIKRHSYPVWRYGVSESSKEISSFLRYYHPLLFGLDLGLVTMVSDQYLPPSDHTEIGLVYPTLPDNPERYHTMVRHHRAWRLIKQHTQMIVYSSCTGWCSLWCP